MVNEQNFFPGPFTKSVGKVGGAREKFKTREGLSHRTMLYHRELREMIGGKEETGSRRWQWGDGREQRGKIHIADIFKGQMRSCCVI